MRKAKLLEAYSTLLVDALSPFAWSAIRQTTTSPFISKGADMTTALAKATEALDADVAATDHPTPAQTAHRDLLRAAVVTELNRLAKFLNLGYPANEPALLSSGLNLSSTASTSAGRTPDSAAAIMDFELLDSNVPGYLLIKFGRPLNTLQNLVRYTIDSNLPEEQWLVAVGGGRERLLGPFDSGTRLSAKAAALTGSTTEPQYSAIKSRIVQ